MTVQTMEQTVSLAFEQFNAKMKTSYSPENIKIGFYTNENAEEERRKFCAKDFPLYLQYPNNLTQANATAFEGKELDGIMINESRCKNKAKKEFLGIILHELAHIFCTHNEIPSGDFFERYCSDTEKGSASGEVVTGYDVWKEFIADYISAFIQGEAYRYKLDELRNGVLESTERINANNLPVAKIALSDFLDYIMISKEASRNNSCESINLWLNKVGLTSFITITSHVYIQMCSDRFWEISNDFIQTLGVYCFEIVIKNSFK